MYLGVRIVPPRVVFRIGRRIYLLLSRESMDIFRLNRNSGVTSILLRNLKLSQGCLRVVPAKKGYQLYSFWFPYSHILLRSSRNPTASMPPQESNSCNPRYSKASTCYGIMSLPLSRATMIDPTLYS